MTGFILWNGEQWKRFAAAIGYGRIDDYLYLKSAEYDAWLAREFPEMQS